MTLNKFYFQFPILDSTMGQFIVPAAFLLCCLIAAAVGTH